MMSADEKKDGQVTIFDLLSEMKEKPEEAGRQSKRPSKSGSGSKWTTKNGYEPFEVVSAIQKMIRRGKEVDAMFWAMELEETNPGWLWKRLMIIAVEDIGLADPDVVLLVKNLWDTYDKVKNMGKGRQPEGNILGMAILSMCRARKNREADDFAYMMYLRRKDGMRLDMPDVALDQHTRRGKEMGRGDEYWFKEANRLSNRVEIEGNPYEKWIKEFYRKQGVQTEYPHGGSYEEDSEE